MTEDQKIIKGQSQTDRSERYTDEASGICTLAIIIRSDIIITVLSILVVVNNTLLTTSEHRLPPYRKSAKNELRKLLAQ